MDDLEKIREIMISWGLWRRTGRLGKELYWPSVSLTGRFLDNMPGAPCPKCKGSGIVPGAPIGIQGNIICPRCEGSGKIRLDTPGKLNPAFVRATAKKIVDHTMLSIDREMCNLRRDQKRSNYYFVLYQEYCRNGTSNLKASRLRITHNNYQVRLVRSLKYMKKKVLTSVISMVENDQKESNQKNTETEF